MFFYFFNFFVSCYLVFTNNVELNSYQAVFHCITVVVAQ